MKKCYVCSLVLLAALLAAPAAAVASSGIIERGDSATSVFVSEGLAYVNYETPRIHILTLAQLAAEGEGEGEPEGPTAGFGFDVGQGQAPMPVQFTDVSDPGT